MSWVSASIRVLVVVLLAGALGAYYGIALEAITAALVLVILFWVYQMHRVQAWLDNPGEAPPDAFGIWGELLTRMYALQRQHMEAQAQLQSTVEYLQDSFAAIREGVVMVDDKDAITWFNEAAEPLLGLRSEVDNGQMLTNLVREPDFKDYFLSGEYAEPLQYQVVRGSEINYLRVEITYFGKGNRVLFVRDVSDSVRLEYMRRDFVANVSHELRTPLTVISGYLGTFADSSSGFPDRYQNALHQMIQQAQRMEGLLKDLLWLSRIESEKRSESLEVIDIGSLFQELKDELREAYPDCTLEPIIESDRPVRGDYQKLYSAVSNLAINAIKYSHCDGSITMSWHVEGENGFLSVQDEGIGIDPVHIPRLTERFYRVDDSRNSSTGGTGLGLAIVKHVAAAHDAQLQIDSRLGEGSTFTLVFPLGG
ncbi:MAG: phosphate regulon sensor histidine kinase PhoR [Halioglobus sp.]|nr:phosphate regulon sensor histidine kinase PhoR [Halioglobus sp.]